MHFIISIKMQEFLVLVIVVAVAVTILLISGLYYMYHAFRLTRVRDVL
jgi:hypothetical protein